MPLDDGCFEQAPGEDGLYGAFCTAGDLKAVVERRAGAWRYAAAFPVENAP
jgi:hypothetical protein